MDEQTGGATFKVFHYRLWFVNTRVRCPLCVKDYNTGSRRRDVPFAFGWIAKHAEDVHDKHNIEYGGQRGNGYL